MALVMALGAALVLKIPRIMPTLFCLFGFWFLFWALALFYFFSPFFIKKKTLTARLIYRFGVFWNNVDLNKKSAIGQKQIMVFDKSVLKKVSRRTLFALSCSDLLTYSLIMFLILLYITIKLS